MIYLLTPHAEIMQSYVMVREIESSYEAYLHGQWFSVSDATAASKDRNNPIFCAVSDAAVASNTENHGSCKQTIKDFGIYAKAH
jgi:hypothetical protein